MQKNIIFNDILKKKRKGKKIMKKTLKTIVLMIIVGIILLTLTGCANINYDIKLNADGS